MEEKASYAVKPLMCPKCGHYAMDHGGYGCRQRTEDGGCDCGLIPFEIAMLHAGEWEAEARAARAWVVALTIKPYDKENIMEKARAYAELLFKGE